MMMIENTATTTLTVKSDTELVIERVFDAPRELVWKATTDPKAIPQWWGPRGFETIVDKMDVRPGGQWRFIHRAPDGSEYGFRGEYREVVPVERIVQTFEFEPMAGHISVESASYEDLGGKTKLSVLVTFDSIYDREGMIDSGMEAGMRETHDRLAEYLAQQTA
jgi:uncharacterized protein YndB with AHSA1/START domain